MRAWLLAVLLAACASPELPRARAAEVEAEARAAPVAVLFSIAGCRWCKIAERGLVAASRDLPAIAFRKVMVEDEDFAALRRRYAFEGGVPQARLLLPGGAWTPLPLTRDGDAVAAAVRRAAGRGARP